MIIIKKEKKKKDNDRMILETYHQSHYITSLNGKDGAKKLF